MPPFFVSRETVVFHIYFSKSVNEYSSCPTALVMSKDIVSRETIEYKKQWTQSVWETVQANGTQIQQKKYSD